METTTASTVSSIKGDIGISYDKYAPLETVNGLNNITDQLSSDIESIDSKLNSNVDNIKSELNILKQRQRKAEKAQRKFDKNLKDEIDSVSNDLDRKYNKITTDIDLIKYQMSDIHSDFNLVISKLKDRIKSLIIGELILLVIIIVLFIILKWR